jgi:adenine specific DNA methylase Mod
MSPDEDTVLNQLYYGDNLHVLRDSIQNECVDLVYLDPPFNSKRNYNLLFKSPKGQESEAQIEAFEDTWHWNEQAEREFDELLHQANTDVAEMVKAIRAFLGENDMMAYLTMMGTRLLELRRVLKSTGSLYLHCDPTASHYLKILLDGVFGKENFRNEIIWKRTTAHGDAKQGASQFGRIHDTIFFYVKSNSATWNSLYTPYEQEYMDTYYKFVDEKGRRYWKDNLTAAKPGGDTSYDWKGVRPPTGRYWAYSKANMERMDKEGRILYTESGFPMYKRYLDEMPGRSVQDLWTDIRGLGGLGSNRAERLGYATQKPLPLLERIIAASSDKGDTILDPFCGCGTAVHAAQKLKRKWIGIDITHLAISLIEKRLKDAFGARCKFEVHGTPKDLEAARDLAFRDKYQFQWWAVSLVDAQPFQGKKKGADTGIDGIKFFRDLDTKDVRKAIVSVKGGGIKPDDVRSLNSVRDREKADIAIFISLEKPTAAMVSDAAAAGFYAALNGKKYSRLQLLTIEGLLSQTQTAEHPDYDPGLNFKKAQQESASEQTTLL